MLQKLYKILLILGIVVTLTAIPAFWLAHSAPAELEVDFLDIGQGDSILIKTPFGQNVLIDGGPDTAVIERLGEELPWWDRTIDLMILTHPHDDHVAGLVDVLKRYQVKRVVYTGVVHTSPNYISWLELIRDKKIPMVIIDRPQTINFGEDCELKILYPRGSILGQTVENLNNSSIVAKLIYKDTSFLLTGDVELEVEQELLNLTPSFRSSLPLIRRGAGGEVDLSAQVLKAGHHGSDTSSSEEFLKAVNPEIVVIQVGADNDFGHPSRRIIKRLERLNSKIFRNDLVGTIKIRSDGKTVKIE